MAPEDQGGISRHVAESIEAVAALHAEAEDRVGRSQRVIERMTGAIGRPVALDLIFVAVSLWIGFNLLGPRLGAQAIDPPPFAYLQCAVSLCALLMTTMVLTTQNRLARRAAHRDHLDLQVNLVSERKIAKLIALIEELRRDLPTVRDRVDPLADAMTEAVDPHAVAQVIERALEGLAASDATAAPEGPGQADLATGAAIRRR